MIWVWILIGFVVGEGSMAGVWYWMEKKRKRQKEVQDKGRVVIPLRDMVQLANINTAMDVGYLMLEYKINLKIPEFYDKYMNLVKKQKELYFRELIEIFSHNKKEYVRDLLDKYAGFSTQDVLLLLMCEMQLDNNHGPDYGADFGNPEKTQDPDADKNADGLSCHFIGRSCRIRVAMVSGRISTIHCW